MIEKPTLHQLVQTIGDNPVEGQIKIIERECMLGQTTWNQKGKVTHVYITLNKGMSHPDEMYFSARKVDWKLLKCPISGVEERKEKKSKDVYDCIDSGDIAALKLLKPRSIKKQPKTKDFKQTYVNPLGYALRHGSMEVIKFLAIDCNQKFEISPTGYYKTNSPYDHIIKNENVDMETAFDFIWSTLRIHSSTIEASALTSLAMKGDSRLEVFKFLFKNHPRLITQKSKSILGAGLYNGQGKLGMLFIDNGIVNLQESLHKWSHNEDYGKRRLKENGITWDELVAYKNQRGY